MLWFHARTVVQEHAASAAADAYAKQFPRFEEAYDALQWLLARKPDKVDNLERDVGGRTYYLYRQAADKLAKTPAIVVVYTFDDDEVNILDVRAEEADEPDE